MQQDKPLKKLLTLLIIVLLPAAARSEPVTLHAVGDIMLAGSGLGVYRKMGYSYPFSDLGPVLKQADIVFGNLEAPLTTGGEEFTDKKFRFRVDPVALDAIKEAGFTHLALANNHIMDFGREGLLQTGRLLDRAGIAWFGAGADLANARKAWITEIKGLKIAFLAYSLVYPEEFFAGKERAGTAPGFAGYFVEDIRLAKSRADYVVVSFHWGAEGATNPKPYQQAAARRAIDAGADAIIGHHPHVLQGVEYYGRGVIFYSLGNFTFGSMGRSASSSMIARITLDDGISQVELIPIDVLNPRVRYRPKLLSGKKAQEVAEEVGRMSTSFGSRVIADNGRFFVTAPLVSISDRTLP